MNVRTVLGGWFGLIVLYTVVTRADATSGLLGTASTALRRIGDPLVPLLPGTRLGITPSALTGAPTGLTGPVSGTGTGAATPAPTGIQGPKIPITL